MKKQSSNGKYIYFSAIAILVVVFSIFVLEKTQITNFYTKAIDDTANSTVRPINDVQYSPANPTDNDEINQKKVDGSIQPNESINESTPIGVVLTAAGQDEVGGPVIVKALLSNVTSGTCDVTISKDDITRNYSASVINLGTYYSCDGFDIPIEELAAGSWKLHLTVSGGDETGETEKNIEVVLK